MARLTVVVLFVLATFWLESDAKRFSRCELVRELRRQGFPEDKMRNCKYFSFYSLDIFYIIQK